jgi:hypothetical protein
MSMIKKLIFSPKIRKYQGQYVAVSKDRVVASGKDAKETFLKAKKDLGREKVQAFYYIPQKKDLLTALYAFSLL